MRSPTSYETTKSSILNALIGSYEEGWTQKVIRNQVWDPRKGQDNVLLTLFCRPGTWDWYSRSSRATTISHLLTYLMRTWGEPRVPTSRMRSLVGVASTIRRSSHAMPTLVISQMDRPGVFALTLSVRVRCFSHRIPEWDRMRSVFSYILPKWQKRRSHD